MSEAIKSEAIKSEATRPEASKNVLVQIPEEIPKDLFISISSEEYCAQVRQKRLKSRQEKYGPDTTLCGHSDDPDSMGLLVAQAEQAKRSPSTGIPQPQASSTLFANPARGAASVVALLVIGIACYTTYFGA